MHKYHDSGSNKGRSDSRYYTSTPYFFQDSSAQMRIVKRRLVNPMRSNEIIQGEAKVSDLLADIFASSTASAAVAVNGVVNSSGCGGGGGGNDPISTQNILQHS